VLAAKRCKKEDCGAMVVEEKASKSEAATDSETAAAPKLLHLELN
jgi:hypothetical protein